MNILMSTYPLRFRFNNLDTVEVPFLDECKGQARGDVGNN